MLNEGNKVSSSGEKAGGSGEARRARGSKAMSSNAGAGAHGDKRGPQLWNPVFVLSIVITFGAFVAGQGLNSSLSVYVEHIGGTATFSGVLSAVFSAAAAVARLSIGSAIDTRGRRIVMVAGSTALALGTLYPGLFPSEASLVIGRIIQGFGFAAVTTASATVAADALPSARMGEGIGYYGLGQALATSIGPAFALFLISTDPAENVFFVLAVVAAVVAVLSASCRYERHPEMLPPQAVYRLRAERSDDGRGCGQASGAEKGVPDNAAESAKRAGLLRRLVDRIFEPGALPGAVPVLLLGAAFGFSISFAGLYGTMLGLQNVGLYYVLSAAAMIVVRLKSKAFMDAMLPIKTLTLATACGVLYAVLLLAAPAFPPLFYLGGLFYGICLGIGLPLHQSIAVKGTPPDRWGAGNALFLLANDIGIGVASMIWGMLNDAFGFPVSLTGVILCMLASYALAWAFYPADAKFLRPRKR